MKNFSINLLTVVMLISIAWSANAVAEDRYQYIEMGDGHYARFELTDREIAAENARLEQINVSRGESMKNDQKWTAVFEMPDSEDAFVFPLSEKEIEKIKHLADARRQLCAAVISAKTGTTIEMGDGQTITFYSADEILAMDQSGNKEARC